ncbi:hypothetical protein GOL41_22010 [Sinorhizobium medicae]|uniref:hypothetical protein n=1 Tax=Sinorhizobium medicae TaxID=110321 RepID=UPI00299ED8B1|nr:hypothetical protein [Sinorhizobium medicae]MDX0406649.1 hypothetical protein [Sinorhizobium medicae]MDX0419001.1 hypothetical protein [Sinorhizobium medicae]MDX0554370.1 hypothetical protein [Sinorhizobium medicae]MDX0586624.1 hypothetical protein [Sinorhizobium medicae]MDX0658119.1 hypothetical protein [Sinorhizobium medicae]
MASVDHDARFQNAVEKLKWWSEIVGILSTWSVLIAISFVAMKAVRRLPDNAAEFQPLEALSASVTMFVVVGATFVFSLRVLWLSYCWVSTDGGRLSKVNNFLVWLVVCIPLFIGVLKIAYVIAETSMQISAIVDEREIRVVPPDSGFHP